MCVCVCESQMHRFPRATGPISDTVAVVCPEPLPSTAQHGAGLRGTRGSEHLAGQSGDARRGEGCGREHQGRN